MSYWDGTRWLPDRPSTPVQKKRPRSRVADWLATAVMLVGLAIIIFPGNPSAAASPRLTASPAALRPGDLLVITGTGFDAGTSVRLEWDGSTDLAPAITVSATGTFEVRVVVNNTTTGSHSITALGTHGAAKHLSATTPIRSLASIDVTVSDAQTAAPTSPPTPLVVAETATPTQQPTVQATAAPTAKPASTQTTSGLPKIDASYGTIFRKVFTDGTFGPFKVLTYPDDHIGGSGQYMTVYNRFSDGARQASVHNGYLDLRATPRGDGLWDAALVGTSQGGNGRTFGYGVYRFWLRFNAAPATWQCAWLYDTTSWSATEIDFPEMLENQSLTAHVLGQGAGGKYGIAKPSHIGSVFHEYKIERRASFVAFSIDGVEVARVNGSMPSSKLAILLDSKVGFGWTASGAPSSLTPDVTYLQVAAVTVDP